MERAQNLVQHQFAEPSLLLQALTHSSYSHELAAETGQSPNVGDNERLEFLGDAVIGLTMAQALMDLFPAASEGNLSRWRSNLVSRKTLAEIASQCALGEMLLLGKGEQRTGGAEKGSILACAFEALVGALYLDAGLEKAREFLLQVYQPRLANFSVHGEKSILGLDKKTRLQERTQQVYRTTPVYRLVESWGAEHAKHFRVELLIGGKAIAIGEGRSKKEAEQQAAASALEVLGL